MLFLKITYQMINILLTTENINRFFQLINRKLQNIIFLCFNLSFINIMNIWIQTYFIILISLLVIKIWNSAQIFEEMLCVERMKIKWWFLLSLIRRTLTCNNFFKSTISFLKYWLCVSDYHGWILWFPSFVLHVVKIFIKNFLPPNILNLS